MPRFSSVSASRLSTCDKRLQEVMNEVVKRFDIAIIEGYRSAEDQLRAYTNGTSRLKPGKSKHNEFPSLAVDIAPWLPTKPHIDWERVYLFHYMAGYVRAIGDTLGVKLRWGGDWDGDLNFHDQTLIDLPHFEIVENG